LGDGFPGLDQVVVGVGRGLRVEGGHEIGLGVEEGGLHADQAGLTPGDGGELVDVHLLLVILWIVGGDEALAVDFEGRLVFDAEDDVDDGREAVLEGVLGGNGLAFDRGWALRARAVDAGLF
jgi:hypothetical protein